MAKSAYACEVVEHLRSLPSLDLPVAEAPRTERADAARNRLAVIDAASRLLRDHEADAITMDAIACAAGVGKGTLFRRFGDRASLFRALVDDRERAFQDAFIRGPAPLGPGATSQERLRAFGHALLEQTEDVGELLVAAEQGLSARRYRHPVYLAHRMHVSSLLEETGASDHAGYMADVLLAALAPELVVFQRGVLGMELEELKDSWAALVASIV
jgi:AcrR family transcriptional regulator